MEMNHMKNNPLIFRQFYNEDHEEYKYFFVVHDNGKSRYINGPSLFGWGDLALRQYTRKFELKIIYD